MRGRWRPNRTAIYWPLLLWPSALCLSRSPGLPKRRPRGPLWWVMAFFTASYQQLLWTPTHRGPRGPLRPRVAFPTTSYQQLFSNSNCNSLISVLTDSLPTQSPTRSLEWHVWSSSSGNNCHAVHRSLSSDASVYECTMGILACPILLAKSTYAISPHKFHRNVSLPSGASLCNGKFGRVEGLNTTHVAIRKLTVSSIFSLQPTSRRNLLFELSFGELLCTLLKSIL